MAGYARIAIAEATMSTELLTQQVLALPVAERARLAQLLRESIPEEYLQADEPDEELIQMLRERCAELDSGADPGIPHEQVMEEARNALR
jgi:putative addiction module component (TIGR02574 family)